MGRLCQQLGRALSSAWGRMREHTLGIAVLSRHLAYKTNKIWEKRMGKEPKYPERYQLFVSRRKLSVQSQNKSKRITVQKTYNSVIPWPFGLAKYLCFILWMRWVLFANGPRKCLLVGGTLTMTQLQKEKKGFQWQLHCPACQGLRCESLNMPFCQENCITRQMQFCLIKYLLKNISTAEQH